MNKIQKLSDTELELMEAIWACTPPVTSTELLRLFAQRGKRMESTDHIYLSITFSGQRSAYRYET